MSNKKTVMEIAMLFGVTDPAVRIWLKKGLPYEVERVLGLRPRKVIDPADVEKFLNLTKRTSKGS